MPQLATFHIGDEIYGVDILLTKEIGKIHEITKVPESPEFYLGLMNLRGQIVTIMDPGVFLEQKSTVSPENRRIIILKTEGELSILRKNGLVQDSYMSSDPLAIVIDQIGDVLDVNSENILPPPTSLTGYKKELVEGVIQLEKKLIILLSMEKLIAACEGKSDDQQQLQLTV